MLRELLKESAIHEAGHALVAWHSPFVSAVHAAIAQKGTGGIVSCEWNDMTCPEAIWDYLTIVLAGAAAETLLLTKANYGSAATDLCGAVLAVDQLQDIGWTVPDELSRTPLTSARRHHPDFLPLEHRLNLPTGTAEMMHAAYHRSYSFLKRHRPSLVKLTALLQTFRELEHPHLVLVLGPRLVTIRAVLGNGHPLD